MTTKKAHITKLSLQEFCQVLAALRHWQQTYARTDIDRIRAEWTEHFEDCGPMTMKAIDELCERINFLDPLRRQED